MGGAIGADDFALASHIQKYMGMIKRGQGANTHKFSGADFNAGDTLSIVKVGCGI